MRKFLIPMALCLALPAVAQDQGGRLEPLADAPPPPPPAAPRVIRSGDVDEQEEDLGPTVTIKTEGERRIEEYRIRGRLYMIKVTNKNTPPYYLIDRDGDGVFEQRLSELDPRIFVPKWVITRW